MYKLKPITKRHIDGLGYLATFAFGFAYFPLVSSYIGANLTYLALSGSLYMSVSSLNQQNLVKSIEVIREGDHEGKLKI
jgi:hypothetical protein